MTTPAAPPPVRPRPSRARRALRLYGVAAAGWLLLEIWLLITVARAAGALTVLLLLVAGVVLGAAAVKRAGRSAWRSLTEAGRRPGESDARAGDTNDAALAMLGGLLLIVPGLASDAVALLCLFPPTRALLRRVGRSLGRGRSYPPGSVGGLFEQARMHRPDGKVIQGEVVDRESPADPGEPGPGDRAPRRRHPEDPEPR